MKPNVSLTNNDIIGILKNNIAFGGEFFTQSGLRTIQVEIFDQNGVSIGPEGLKTVIMVNPTIEILFQNFKWRCC